jgi:peptidoglycan-associated lipoprotein
MGGGRDWAPLFFKEITMKWKLGFAAMILAVAVSGCSKKQDVKPDDGASDVISDSGSSAMDSDSGNAMGLQTIRFPYDSHEVVGPNRQVLQENIRIMKDNGSLNVQIEGHCDERGGIQYNLALGERRANAVKQQMVAGGIAGSRITTISFGKERPAASGSGEEAWAQNRRANFAITSK